MTSSASAATTTPVPILSGVTVAVVVSETDTSTKLKSTARLLSAPRKLDTFKLLPLTCPDRSNNFTPQKAAPFPKQNRQNRLVRRSLRPHRKTPRRTTNSPSPHRERLLNPRSPCEA